MFLCILTCTATWTFNKFCYFLSIHQTNINKFPNSFYFISYLLQLSSINVYIDWKNQLYTHYYSYYNLSILYIKKIRIYIVPVNPKLDYYIIIIILCALTAKLYLEVQLCTTCKAVNHKYYLCKMIPNLLLLFLLYVWKTSLLLIIYIYIYIYIYIIIYSICIALYNALL